MLSARMKLILENPPNEAEVKAAKLKESHDCKNHENHEKEIPQKSRRAEIVRWSRNRCADVQQEKRDQHGSEYRFG